MLLEKPVEEPEGVRVQRIRHREEAAVEAEVRGGVQDGVPEPAEEGAAAEGGRVPHVHQECLPDHARASGAAVPHASDGRHGPSGEDTHEAGEQAEAAAVIVVVAAQDGQEGGQVADEGQGQREGEGDEGVGGGADAEGKGGVT